jgi:hypothetical protein
LYATILGYKLRVIWHRAEAGRNPEAAVARLITQTRDFQHVRYGCIRSGEFAPGEVGPDGSPWCRKTLGALEWLKKNTHKLKRCGISECKRFPYFIVSPSHKTYCSDVCKEIAEMMRGAEKAKTEAADRQSETKVRYLSPEGAKKISEAAKKRHEEARQLKLEKLGSKKRNTPLAVQ